MTTGPWVIGITQLQGHRNDPCRLLSLPILACAPHSLGAALVSASRTMASPIWPHGSKRRKRVLAGRKPDLPDLVRVVTSPLLLSKCRQSFRAEGFPCPHPIIPPSLPANR